jgi:polysaccharide biosynthesis/export protein
MNQKLEKSIMLRLCVALCTTFLLVGCMGKDENSRIVSNTFNTTEPAPAIGGRAAAQAEKIFATGSTTPVSSGAADYKIAPLDVVDISVFGVQDLTRTVQVSSTGMISLPLIRTVKAGGKTTGELEREIAERLNASYLQSPQVSVFVKEYNSQRITVDGAVTKPGIFPINGSVSLMQAIALSQGLSTVADPSGVLIFRQVNNKRTAARFDLRQVRSGKIPDPMLQAGDIVMVDESAARTTLRDIKDALPLSGLFQLLTL